MSSDRIAFLEDQLLRLKSELDEERLARREATSQVHALISELQHRSPSNPARDSRRYQTPPKEPSPQHATTTRPLTTLSPKRGENKARKPSPVAVGAKRYTTPTRSPPRGSQRLAHLGDVSSGEQSRRTATPDNNKFATPRSTFSRSTPPRPTHGSSGASTPRSAASANRSATKSIVVSQKEKSGLELSWDSFVARVQVLSSNELALVTAATLTKLLDSFGIMDEMERAKIEAQWSIYQREADEMVGRFGIHNAAFDVRPVPAKPTLSKRTSLEKRQTRGSNPNESGGGGDVPPRQSPQGIRTMPTGLISSNPNEVLTRDDASYRRPSVRKVPESPRAEPRATGIMSVPKPESREQNPRGIRSVGSTHECRQRTSPTGLRAPLCPPDEFGPFHREGSPMGLPRRSSMGARGIRTFASDSSPNDDYFGLSVKSPRASFVRRDSLTTSTGLSSPTGRVNSPSLSLRQSRTPFAVDD